MCGAVADMFRCLLRRAIGQMLIMGWDGTEVTPQIRNLIEEHHLGAILLTAKNLKCELPLFPHRRSWLCGAHVTTPMLTRSSAFQLPKRRRGWSRISRQ